MKAIGHLNLLLAWWWIAFGFIAGLLLGLKFHDENWLGGYGSWKRRLYRLGHISFFGLAMVNLVFFFTAQKFPAEDFPAQIASVAFVIGALTMPACCLLMAHFPKLKSLFAIPVVSLLAGASFTIFEITKL